MTAVWQSAVDEWLSAIDVAVDALSTVAENAAEEGDWQALAHILANLRAVKRNVAVVESLTEGYLAKTMPSKPRVQVVPGLGSLERKKGATRKAYDHTLVASRIAALAADTCFWDRETAEEIPPAVAAQNVIDLLLKVGHVDYWRVEDCKELGIDIDNYCVKTPGDPSVIIRPAGQEKP